MGERKITTFDIGGGTRIEPVDDEGATWRVTHLAGERLPESGPDDRRVTVSMGFSAENAADGIEALRYCAKCGEPEWYTIANPGPCGLCGSERWTDGPNVNTKGRRIW